MTHTFETHSLALYNIISDVRFIATDTGMIVWTNGGDLDEIRVPPAIAVSCLVQTEQNTLSHVSQYSNSY